MLFRHLLRDSLAPACVGALLSILLASPARADLAPLDPPEVTACAGKQANDTCDFNNSGKPGTCRATPCNRLDYSKGSPPQVIESQCLDCVAAAEAPPASTPPAGSPPAAPPPASESAGRCRIDPTSAPLLLLLLAAFLRRRR